MRSTPMNRELRTTCIGALRTGRTADEMDEENRSAGRLLAKVSKVENDGRWGEDERRGVDERVRLEAG